MSDVIITNEEHPHGRLRRFMHWLGDHESQQSREYYANAGIWSSRLYAVILPFVVLLTAWAEPVLGVAAILGMIWGFISRMYLWYQAKAVIAFPVIEERHANRDQFNSILPLVSLAGLIILWVLMIILYYTGLTPKTISYTVFGWYVIAVGFYDVGYDLLINNRNMFVLSKVPARAEYNSPPPPHD